MPLSDIQRKILKLLAANRSPDKYLAGATVLHRSDCSPRYSQDLDFFHDLAQNVAQSAEHDASVLLNAGYAVKWILRNPTFYRAVVEFEDKSVSLEWAQDSAFRFFPLQEDEDCGYRLHYADAACNKMLALAGRQEARDYVDILHINESYLGLGTLSWAACGKDPGYTPEFILDHTARHVAYKQADIDRLNLVEHMDLRELKQKWLTAKRKARDLIEKLPAREIGCLYLDQNGIPVNPTPESKTFSNLTRHFGCISGAWPAPMANR